MIKIKIKVILGLCAAAVALPALAPAMAEEHVPFQDEWALSGHNDPNAEAFRHWDGDDPPEIPTSCAKCHSAYGYRDFLGVDGTAAGTVDNAAPVGSTIECKACHNDAAAEMDSVVMPSGVVLEDLGSEARCMQCHQGRESSVSLEQDIADSGAAADDTAVAGLGFSNIHYYPAAATLYGAEALGGAQFPGKTYDIKFAHVEEADSCVECHNPHSLELKVNKCSECHKAVASKEDLHDIRFVGSTKDYDGDGNVEEGIAEEIATLQDVLYGAMQIYAMNLGAGIIYDSHSYPYFFKDNNGNGQVDEGEASYGNRYSDFSPNLLRAAYNYQMSNKDPGAFAHNAKYVIQLLYDSIEAMDPTLVAGLARDDAGHFAGAMEAWRHWDEDGGVSSSCSRCHSAEGLGLYLEADVTLEQEVANGMKCTTCHSDVPGYARHETDEVEFPSGAMLSFGAGDDSNLCITCHQGRESAASVNASIAGKPEDTPSSSLRFRNIHYYPAGATFFGTLAKGAYEYPGKLYKGKRVHIDSLDSCVECHDAHSGRVAEGCGNPFCHTTAGDNDDIRMGMDDFDGDGFVAEGLAGDIDTLHHKLLEALQAYCSDVVGKPIIYASAYPYFFNDNDGDGEVDPGEAIYPNSYKSFTPRSLKAAYNYQWVKKDPGAHAHNGRYAIQVLIDAIDDIGGDVSGTIRPEGIGGLSKCGDATHPYPAGDVNKDCKVDFADIAIITGAWLTDSSPL